MNSHFFTVTEDEQGERLDKYLAGLLPDVSRSFIQKLLKQQQVTVNETTVKANYIIKEHDTISIYVPEAVEPEIVPENIPLDILYEDDDVLVVNKPKNMVVHPAPGHYSGTLVNAVMFHCRITYLVLMVYYVPVLYTALTRTLPALLLFVKMILLIIRWLHN